MDNTCGVFFVQTNKIFHRKKVRILCFVFLFCLLALGARLTYLMVIRGEYYSEKAQKLHERERPVKAARGKILDRNGKILADNRAVTTVSVIHSQISDENEVIRKLSELLEMDEEKVRKKVEKVSSMERIASNVEKETGDKIRKLGLSGVKVDEDYITRNLVANEGDVMYTCNDSSVVSCEWSDNFENNVASLYLTPTGSGNTQVTITNSVNDEEITIYVFVD